MTQSFRPAATARLATSAHGRVEQGLPELEAQGVGTESGRYSESAISNWIKGRTMPPADVLLAAAKLAGISVDEKITGQTPTSADVRAAALDLEVHELRRELDRME